MLRKFTRGFTLIELLVVIAIIGVLASVVLVSLQSARKKGGDSRVISDVQQMRTHAESTYNGTNYNAAMDVNTADAAANIATGAGLEDTGVPNTLATDAFDNGGVLFAKTTATNVTAYSIYGALPSTGNTRYFCIASDGSTRQSTTNRTSVGSCAD